MVSDAEARAARAVATQARVHPANPLLAPRALVSTAANWRKTKGTCPWCNEPSDELEHGWHSSCRQYYSAARGATHYEVNGIATPLVAKTSCAKCGDVAQKIDHIVPLAAARGMTGTEMLKVWTTRNLQWLCASCRNVKITVDFSRIRTTTSNGKAMQPSLF